RGVRHPSCGRYSVFRICSAGQVLRSRSPSAPRTHLCPLSRGLLVGAIMGDDPPSEKGAQMTTRIILQAALICCLLASSMQSARSQAPVDPFAEAAPFIAVSRFVE